MIKKIPITAYEIGIDIKSRNNDIQS